MGQRSSFWSRIALGQDWQMATGRQDAQGGTDGGGGGGGITPDPSSESNSNP